MGRGGRGGGRRLFPFYPSTSLPAAIGFSLLLLNLSQPRASAAPSPPPSSALAFDYGDALTKSLLYFEAQRSGRLPYNQRVSWRHHSALSDGLEQGVDLVGGYYDAGDNVKFGLPMAFTVTMVAWGVVEYGEEIAGAGELEHALEAIKWGTDYLDMTTSRRAFKIDASHPGSDLASETAAAMAAASVVFRRRNPHYSHLLLHHAQQLFDVAAARKYYASVSGYDDELLWAALWLHRATAGAGLGDDGSGVYLDYVVRNGHALGGTGWAVTEFSWDIKYAGVQVLASKLLMERGQRWPEEAAAAEEILMQFQSKAEHYLCACLGKNNGTNVRRTPGGLLYVRPWNNMQYVSGAAFLLTVYADALRRSGQALPCPGGAARPSDLLSTAKSSVDYILGANPMGLSYLVGYGPRFPRQVHHRGASMTSYKETRSFIGCTQGYDDWYGRQEDNPNILVGALVGGPGGDDVFQDERQNYMQTEACTYNTAPLIGVFAKLHRLRLEESAGGPPRRCSLLNPR
ncbi:unnamed protein product [Spirodela intermedia]|uniref:Endoglucanase n=1 Tax=Spirodela intermedia TaxID=51605 RepID=A0A7I8JSX7_SPIIN|nr:unnamed protein product [Spirodela intermedia]CAA6673229.1 unnamed protein product [Spirodela intermedia]